ncbi:MAG: type II toxin-antitoxin system RelE/ParE family toxin [Deltaproteobacteria bacterium]|nr:type II toxin-antitoxin system RelE/ParE family toxin [Deltaproteobacteria bacterium]
MDKMEPGKMRAQISRRARALAKNPFPPGNRKLKGKKFAEGRARRVRQGDYRIIYEVRDNPPEVVILDIDNRKDAYR